MSHARQLEEAWRALHILVLCLDELAGALHEDHEESEGWNEGVALDTAGENAAMAALDMANELCAIDSLKLPDDMREEAPSLDEILAYLASIGRLDNEKAAEIAAGIIEYLQSADYGRYPRGDDYPAFEEHETMTNAIDALLSSLEHEP